MPVKPAAEIEVGETVVRRLLRAQAATVPDAATLRLRRTAEGWDCVTWRLGDHLAVRLPRRAVAAGLVANEQRWLPAIADRLSARGILVPTPLVAGRPTPDFPWPWSVVPWIPGSRGIDVPRADRAGWAESLASALGALHVGAPGDFPANPFRGGHLATRSGAVSERLAQLSRAGTLSGAEADAAASVWAAGLAAAAFIEPPLWIHGDLHPANLVAQGSRLVGIIDFGDVTAGDPAYDLAVAWLTFDEIGRGRFRRAIRDRHDDATWTRARAWATAVALMLLAHSDDEPAYAALGREAFDEVTRHPRE